MPEPRQTIPPLYRRVKEHYVLRICAGYVVVTRNRRVVVRRTTLGGSCPFEEIAAVFSEFERRAKDSGLRLYVDSESFVFPADKNASKRATVEAGETLYDTAEESDAS